MKGCVESKMCERAKHLKFIGDTDGRECEKCKINGMMNILKEY